MDRQGRKFIYFHNQLVCNISFHGLMEKVISINLFKGGKNPIKDFSHSWNPKGKMGHFFPPLIGSVQ